MMKRPQHSLLETSSGYASALYRIYVKVANGLSKSYPNLTVAIKDNAFVRVYQDPQQDIVHITPNPVGNDGDGTSWVSNGNKKIWKDVTVPSNVNLHNILGISPNSDIKVQELVTPTSGGLRKERRYTSKQVDIYVITYQQNLNINALVKTIERICAQAFPGSVKMIEKYSLREASEDSIDPATRRKLLQVIDKLNADLDVEGSEGLKGELAGEKWESPFHFKLEGNRLWDENEYYSNMYVDDCYEQEENMYYEFGDEFNLSKPIRSEVRDEPMELFTKALGNKYYIDWEDAVVMIICKE